MSETIESVGELRSPATTKLFIVALLAGGLMLAIALVEGVIHERATRAVAAQREVAATWGGAQTLTGPIVALPFCRAADVEASKKRRCGWLRVLPDELEVRAVLEPEVRSRSIFDVVVYNQRLDVSGRFEALRPEAWGLGAEDVDWGRAVLSVGLSDLRGIRAVDAVEWSGSPRNFAPGLGDGRDGGLHAAITDLAPGQPGEFRFQLQLTGSEAWTVAPVGATTKVAVRSTWPDPSFFGAFPPQRREVRTEGFEAEWQVSHFARNYPQWFRSDERSRESMDASIHGSRFGVRLLQPVDLYRQAIRAVKYAELFIVVTFGAFFLLEILGGLRIHPMQYLLVGAALALFYLLLLSLAEHVGFGFAYAFATSATIAMTVGYASRVLGGWQRAGIAATGLGGLYLYLYVLLQLQDWSLLLGSLGLTAILGAVMYLTRDVDWYAAGRGESP